MKYALISLLLSCQFCATGTAAEDEIVLTIGEGITWKSIFDAGFRPRHMSEGRFGCVQFDVNCGIRLSADGEVLHLGKGDIQFEILDEHILVLLMFYGRENRTVEEAEEKSETFARIFGQTLTKKSEVRRFKATNRIDHSEAINSARIDDFSIIYSFSNSFNRDRPMLERFSVSLKSKVAKRGKRLESKVEPPEGYEHISLVPGVEPKVGEGDLGLDRASEEGNEVEKKRFPWFMLLLGVIGFLGLIAVLVRSGKRKE